MEDSFNHYLIIGLGNPGQKYQDTRHNIGFNLIDTLLDSDSMSIKFKSLYSKIEINKNPIHIIKPQTFMNESGVAVNEVSKFFKIKQENIIVVYDDLDLPIGNLKIKVGGGSAGHNGIKSIEKYIETNEKYSLYNELAKISSKFYSETILPSYYKARYLEESGKPEKAMMLYRSAYNMKEVQGLTKDYLLKLADQIQSDFNL